MVDGKSLSEMITKSAQKIIEQWKTEAQNKVPAAATLNDEELLNKILEFLKNLASSFSVESGSAQELEVAKSKVTAAQVHGMQRAQKDFYTLDQVIAEHQILRRILLHFLLKNTSIQVEQWDILFDFIDIGISEAASIFALERGFKDAKYYQLELEKNQIQTQKNTADSELSKLQLERTLRESFVNMLSHDMRTPISSAKLSAELILLCFEENEQVHKLASKIVKDLSRSDRMIRDLLDANRIRFGQRLPLKIRETKLIQLIENTLFNLAEIYGERFKLERPYEIVGFWSDEDLQRVIENLAINAVKYGSEDTPIHFIVLYQGNEVSISVHNSGSYIAPEEKKLLLDYDQQIRGLNKSSKKGWGLGLTLVQGIVNAHGGQLHLESEVKMGTTFSVIIPKDARIIENASSGQTLAS